MKIFRIFPKTVFPLLIAGSLLPTLGTAQQRMAFIVGTDRYDNLPASAQLNVAVEDASLLSDTLKGLKPAFDVTLVTDGNRSDIGKKLLDFMTKAKGAECVLFYFAGHGIEYHGANYLLASDTDLDFGNATVPESKRILEGKAIHLEKVIEMLSKTDANITVAILDACRNNPLEGTSAAITGLTAGTIENPNAAKDEKLVQKIGHVTAPSGMIISYAADVGQSANDGLFTAILAENMKTPARPIMEVFAATRMQVREKSESMSRENRGVAHEPAEYCKLDLEGLQFSFLPVDRPATRKPATTVALDKAPSDPPAAKSGELGIPPIKKEAIGTRDFSSALEVAVTSEETENAYNALRGKAGTITFSRYHKSEARKFGDLEMVWCPPTGESGFLMGSPLDEKGRNDDEGQRNVILTRGFWLAETECTLKEWHAGGGNLSQRDKRESPHWPVNGKSHEEVAKYFDAKTASSMLPPGWVWSLPTEAQWEYACRARQTKAFGYSDTISNKRENFRGAGGSQLIPKLQETGTRSGNSWGFHDMHGNVREWCLDWYSKNPEELIDPAGPRFGDFHVIRGGQYKDDMDKCRAASRSPRHSNETAGFRQAIVFSADEFRKFKEAEKAKEFIDLSNGTIYGVGIGDDVTTVRAALVKHGILNDEKKAGRLTTLFAEFCIFRFRDSRFCNEIWTGRNKVTLSNGLEVGSDLSLFDEKFGRAVAVEHPKTKPKTLERKYRAGLLHVCVVADRENPDKALQLAIRPIR